MKVIFINRFFFPDHSATSQLLTDLAVHLAQNAFDVTVLTSRQTYDDPGTIHARKTTIDGVRVIRLWTTRFGRQHLPGRAVDYLTFYISALWRLLSLVSRGDVIVAKTDPPLISVVSAVVARIRSAVLINWIQDLFPEVASALTKQISASLERPLRALRNRSLLIARRNVVIGEGMATKLRDEGIPSACIRVIHNWADGLAIQPIDPSQNELRREWNLDDKFVVGYSGNFGRAHEFRTILSAAEILRDHTYIKFLFIGAGAQLASMVHEVKGKRLRNVIFKPYQPREQLSMSLSVPDVHVISLLPALEGLIVPSKFYGIAAAGRPMLYIGDKAGEIPQLIRSTHCGFTVEVYEAQEAAAVINRLARDTTACRQLGDRARSLFDHRFDKSYAEKAWQMVIAEAIHQA